ncbi:MAG TPA: hypothetical protein VHN77_08975 [Phycisphaerales bacterium]|nr:hypothetical protein [Phycisphaerales bacterium]
MSDGTVMHQAAMNSPLPWGFTRSDSRTIQMAGEVPDDSWDYTDLNRTDTNTSTTRRVLCTFRESDTGWVRVEAVPTLNTIRLRWHDGTTLDMTSNDAKQILSYLRGSPVLFALSRSGEFYKFYASVGGTTVFTAETWDAPAVAPTSICIGDKSKHNVEPMNWYGGSIDIGALTDSQVQTSLRELGMIFAKTVYEPPGKA